MGGDYESSKTHEERRTGDMHDKTLHQSVQCKDVNRHLFLSITGVTHENFEDTLDIERLK